LSDVPPIDEGRGLPEGAKAIHNEPGDCYFCEKAIDLDDIHYVIVASRTEIRFNRPIVGAHRGCFDSWADAHNRLPTGENCRYVRSQ